MNFFTTFLLQTGPLDHLAWSSRAPRPRAMQASKMLPAVALAGLTIASADSTNPMAEVLELMDDCSAKIVKDGEAEAKAYKEYFEWCDDASKDSQFAIKT